MGTGFSARHWEQWQPGFSALRSQHPLSCSVSKPTPFPAGAVVWPQLLYLVRISRRGTTPTVPPSQRARVGGRAEVGGTVQPWGGEQGCWDHALLQCTAKGGCSSEAGLA